MSVETDIGEIRAVVLGLEKRIAPRMNTSFRVPGREYFLEIDHLPRIGDQVVLFDVTYVVHSVVWALNQGAMSLWPTVFLDTL